MIDARQLTKGYGEQTAEEGLDFVVKPGQVTARSEYHNPRALAALRSAAGGISLLVVTLMLIPGLAILLPSSWRDPIGPYLPSNAGESMFTLTHDATTPAPSTSLLVLIGWSALAPAGAACRLMRSDA